MKHLSILLLLLAACSSGSVPYAPGEVPDVTGVYDVTSEQATITCNSGLSREVARALSTYTVTQVGDHLTITSEGDPGPPWEGFIASDGTFSVWRNDEFEGVHSQWQLTGKFLVFIDVEWMVRYILEE